MAENGMVSGMGESDITAMKETLRAQQQLLQKLYTELDEEREASATATSEALDMILRLQGEKAAVKMEASHYKRMAEEKIEHTENTLEVFEELMYQKEMEIASLEFQVQAYKHKLLCMGCDLTASEFDFPENLLEQRNEQNEQTSTVRRLSSLPPLPVNKNPSIMRTGRRRTRSPSLSPAPITDMIPKIVAENCNLGDVPLSLDSTRRSSECTYETLDSYWNQIKRLDEKVKVISDCKECEGEQCANPERRGISRSCSIFSQASVKSTGDQTQRIPCTNSEQVNHFEGPQDMEAGANPSSSVNVHDVFEVPPQPRKTHRVKRRERWNSEAENRLTKPDSLSEGMIESHVKHESEKLSSMLTGNHDFTIHSPEDTRTMIDQKKDVMAMDCSASSHRPTMSRVVSQSEIHKLHLRVENRLTKPDSLSEGMIESHVKHESEKLSSMLTGNHDFKIHSPEDTRTMIDQKKDVMGIDCSASSHRPTMSRVVSQSEIHKLHQRVERLEAQRISTREEITREGDGEEHLRLLKDIHSQLNSIHSEMRSWKTQISPPKSERHVNLHPLQEAMLYFWL